MQKTGNKIKIKVKLKLNDDVKVKNSLNLKKSNGEVKANPLNINKMCRFKRSEHADINTLSDVGRIVKLVGDDGYGVEVTKKFLITNKFVHQSAIIYAEAKDIELI